MKPYISHDWNEETIESKARWFQSLTDEQRMDYLCEFTDFVLDFNPKLLERRDAESTRRGLLVLRKEKG